MPRRSKAIFAAAIAMSEVAMDASAMRRSQMPVRSRIQASFVSTIFDNCSFVRMPGGTKLPMALILAVGKIPQMKFKNLKIKMLQLHVTFGENAS
jgi:hypothetical protein